MENKVILVDIVDLKRGETTHSLVFTKQKGDKKALQLAIYHVFNLHENSPSTFPSPNSIRLNNNNQVVLDGWLEIKAKIIKKTNVDEIHKLGKLGLFGYSKKLKYLKDVPDFSFNLINYSDIA